MVRIAMSARVGKLSTWRSTSRRLTRALLLALIGLLAVFAFDGVAHAADPGAKSPVPAHSCAATPTDSGFGTSLDRDDSVFAAHGGGHSALGDGGGDKGAAHGALTACAMLAVAITPLFAIRRLVRQPMPVQRLPLRAPSPSRWLKRQLGVLKIFELGTLRI